MDIINLSKVLPILVYPLSASVGLGLASLILLLFRKIAAGVLLLTIALAILCAAGNPKIATALVASIERSHAPLSPEKTPAADAIVVLAGVLGLPTAPRVSADLKDSADRILHASRLFRSGKAPLVIVSGGNVYPHPQAEPESFYISRLLQEWGVPEKAIVTEGKSRNTYQNALETKRLIDRFGVKKVLLVTSALHMPRALAAFRSLGIDARPAVTDVRATHPVPRRGKPPALDWLPNADALAMTTLAIHEYVGFWAYRWWGWIDARSVRSPAPSSAG